jgi:nicotinate-nucleotide pyrophosphorylase (carboxylating)
LNKAGLNLDFEIVDKIIQNSLEEDLNYHNYFGEDGGDITSLKLNLSDKYGFAKIILHEDATLAGLEVMERVFKTVDADTEIILKAKDGQNCKKDTVVATIKGKIYSLLGAERTALNFIQHISAITTKTRYFVRQANRFGVKVLDTRKTIPGMRYLQKYAVRCGGGFNHRFGLFDGIFIKDNHILCFKDIEECLSQLTESDKKTAILEVTDVGQLESAIALGIKKVLLDNMSIDEMKTARMIAGPEIYLEASGGINKGNFSDIIKTGINGVSIGGLTHSVKAVDFSMDVDKAKGN